MHTKISIKYSRNFSSDYDILLYRSRLSTLFKIISSVLGCLFHMLYEYALNSEIRHTMCYLDKWSDNSRRLIKCIKLKISKCNIYFSGAKKFNVKASHVLKLIFQTCECSNYISQQPFPFINLYVAETCNLSGSKNAFSNKSPLVHNFF